MALSKYFDSYYVDAFDYIDTVHYENVWHDGPWNSFKLEIKEYGESALNSKFEALIYKVAVF